MGCVLGCIGFILIAAFLFGVLVFKGANSVTYKNQAKKMFNASQKWGDEMKSVKTVTQGKTIFETIKIASEKNLETLEKSNPPSTEKTLDAALKEYYGITKKVATGFSAVFDWLSEIENISNEFKKISSLDASSPENFARSSRDFKANFDKSLLKIDSMTVPAEIAEKHNALEKYLHDFSDGLGKMITAADTKNQALMTSSRNDLTTALNNITLIFSVESFSELYKKDIERANELENEIVELLNK